VKRGVPIGLTRANGFGPLPLLFEQRAGEKALRRSFEELGLPMALIERPDTPIPARSMVQIFDLCARYLGDRMLGLEIGERMVWTGFGPWAQHGMAAPTLREAIGRLSATLWAHCIGTRLALTRESTHWVWRVTMPPMEIQPLYHSDHILPPMLGLCRLYLGDDWAPDWVETSYRRDRKAYAVEERLRVPVVFGRESVGVALRPGDLARTRRSDGPEIPQPLSLRHILDHDALPAAPEPTRSLSAVVALRLMDGKTDIEGAAKLAHTGVQGLQRRLRETGYTYREVVEGVRAARARSLLADDDLPVVEIALLLGYEEHASFTRAFKRRFGVPPSDYRAAAQSRRQRSE